MEDIRCQLGNDGKYAVSPLHTKLTRKGKHLPFIVHWLKGLKVKHGSVTYQRGLLIDFMANFLNLTGAEYLALISERGMGALQGKSPRAIFFGQLPRPPPSLFSLRHRPRALTMAVETHFRQTWPMGTIQFQDGSNRDRRYSRATPRTSETHGRRMATNGADAGAVERKRSVTSSLRKDWLRFCKNTEGKPINSENNR